ncbi:hypothetical protein TcWFU_003189 [Taenia crassiceps]|uniref:Uncharacterized protein n=1 Tax=Taenia crassiceps TaxID=6207 RepID=A0ABR4Q846_9CEST
MLIQPHCSAHHSTNALFPTFNLLAASLALTVCLSLTPITLDLSAPPLPPLPSPPLPSPPLPPLPSPPLPSSPLTSPLLRFLTSSVDTCDAAALHASIHSIHEVHSCPCFCLVQKHMTLLPSPCATLLTFSAFLLLAVTNAMFKFVDI